MVWYIGTIWWYDTSIRCVEGIDTEYELWHQTPECHHSRGYRDIWQSVALWSWPKTRYKSVFSHGRSKLTANKRMLLSLMLRSCLSAVTRADLAIVYHRIRYITRECKDMISSWSIWHNSMTWVWNDIIVVMYQFDTNMIWYQYNLIPVW